MAQRWLRVSVVAGIFLGAILPRGSLCGSACGASAPQNQTGVEETLRAAFPNLTLDGVFPTPVKGLFEVVAGPNVFYFAPETGHVLFGELWSREGTSLTAERRRELTAKVLEALPLGQAVRVGSGPKVVIEVSDPDCAFCREGHRYLNNRKDVTRYVFFYPLPVHPRAREKAQFILASPEPAKAYEEVMAGAYDERSLPRFEPNGRLEAHVESASKLDVRATPHYWIGGVPIPGADLRRIQELLR